MRGCLRLTFYHGRWTDLTRARCRRRTACRSRTFDFGATGPGARWALPLGFIALATIQDDRLGLRDRGLENIVAQIGHRWHLRFKDIISQIGNLGARGHCALEDIAAHVGLPTRGASGLCAADLSSCFLKAFKHRTTKHNSYDDAY
jgi:hypothetical protein